jgi:hypothetical protein
LMAIGRTMVEHLHSYVYGCVACRMANGMMMGLPGKESMLSKVLKQEVWHTVGSQRLRKRVWDLDEGRRFGCGNKGGGGDSKGWRSRLVLLAGEKSVFMQLDDGGSKVGKEIWPSKVEGSQEGSVKNE